MVTGPFVRIPFCLLAAGTCGWAIASPMIAAANRWAMPAPPRVRPLPCVVIDRGLSAVPLAEGLYPKGGSAGYGMLEASIPRLGCTTVRKKGSEVFSGDVLVVICPSRSVSEELSRRVGAICGRRRQAAGDRLAGEHGLDGEQSALAVRTFDSPRSSLEGQADHRRINCPSWT